MAGRRGDFVYKTDDDRLYAVLLDRSNATIPDLGLVEYTDQTDPLAPDLYLTRQPEGLRLRKVVCFNPETGNRRELVVGNTNSDIWNGQTKTVDLPDFNLLEFKEYQIIARIEERQFLPPKPII